MSPASAHFHTQDVSEPLTADGDSLSPGELLITSTLVDEFLGSLEAYGIFLRFFSGSWANFDLKRCGGRYDIILTSETIYRKENMDSLVTVMRAACASGSRHDDPQTQSLSYISEEAYHQHLCLVAAKVLYFGVGGGFAEFVRAVERQDPSCRVETVWERHVGVGRKIMRVKWGDDRDWLD
jgi:protein-histidine N-methyltransferase